MPDQDKGHGHHAMTREAVHELFTSGRGEKGADGVVRIRGLTEDEYFAQLDKAQEHADRIIGGDTWHDASLDPNAQRHHAMADPHKSGEQNVEDIHEFITGELESAYTHQGAAGTAKHPSEEMMHLGTAAHALEDSYSNAHMFRGEAVFEGDPTAPIESLNVFHPLGLHHNADGWAEGTHNVYLDHVPVGHGTEDAWHIAHNPDGSVPLEHQSDLAGARATAELLERYEDDRAAQGGAAALDHAVDDFFHTNPSGVGVNKHFSDAAFQQELHHRVEIEKAQQAAMERADYEAAHPAQVVQFEDEVIHADESGE